MLYPTRLVLVSLSSHSFLLPITWYLALPRPWDTLSNYWWNSNSTKGGLEKTVQILFSSVNKCITLHHVFETTPIRSFGLVKRTLEIQGPQIAGPSLGWVWELGQQTHGLLCLAWVGSSQVNWSGKTGAWKTNLECFLALPPALRLWLTLYYSLSLAFLSWEVEMIPSVFLVNLGWQII